MGLTSRDGVFRSLSADADEAKFFPEVGKRFGTCGVFASWSRSVVAEKKR
jgi:hypothetical protein